LSGSLIAAPIVLSHFVESRMGPQDQLYHFNNGAETGTIHREEYVVQWFQQGLV
jgi:hypothetical protein